MIHHGIDTAPATAVSFAIAVVGSAFRSATVRAPGTTRCEGTPLLAALDAAQAVASVAPPVNNELLTALHAAHDEKLHAPPA